jgi:hypothetical protein
MQTHMAMALAVGTRTQRIARRLGKSSEAVRQECRQPFAEETPYGTGKKGRYERFLELFEAILEENREGAVLLFEDFTARALSRLDEGQVPEWDYLVKEMARNCAHLTDSVIERGPSPETLQQIVQTVATLRRMMIAANAET